MRGRYGYTKGEVASIERIAQQFFSQITTQSNDFQNKISQSKNKPKHIQSVK